MLLSVSPASRRLQQVIEHIGVVEATPSISVITTKDHNVDAYGSANIARTGFPRRCLKRPPKMRTIVLTFRCDHLVILVELFEHFGSIARSPRSNACMASMHARSSCADFFEADATLCYSAWRGSWRLPRDAYCCELTAIHREVVVVYRPAMPYASMKHCRRS